MKKIPLTIISGYLGSGKTTLLNNILNNNENKRIAIIENEFGEISIDSELILKTSEEIIELKNGCICCNVRKDLIDTLNRLVTKKDSIDYIIIETTGLASISPIIMTLYLEDNIKDNIELDGIITVVDAKNFKDSQSLELKEQIAYADVIILNKTDLVNEIEKKEIIKEVIITNLTAKIIKAVNCNIKISDIIGIEKFNINKLNINLKNNNYNGHNGDIKSISIVDKRELDLDKVNLWFENLISKYGKNIIRMKGILNIYGLNRKYIFQGVQTLFEGKISTMWDNNKENKIVFIGRNLDRDSIIKGFESCIKN